MHTHLDRQPQVFLRRWMGCESSPLRTALRELKFFSLRQSSATCSHCPMTLALAWAVWSRVTLSCEVACRMVATVTRVRRLNCSTVAQTEGACVALSSSLLAEGNLTHSWHLTPRNSSYTHQTHTRERGERQRRKLVTLQ